MKKGKILLFCIVLFLILGILFFTFPIWQSKRDLFKLENKVFMVNELFSKGGNASKVKEAVGKKVVHARQETIEASVNSYLNDLVTTYQEVDHILGQKEYQSMFLLSTMQHDGDYLQKNITLLENNRKELEEKRNVLKELSSSKKRDSYAKKDILNTYNSIVKKIKLKYCKEYIKVIDSSIENMDKEILFMNYLLNHIDSWKVTFQGIEFQTRSSFSDFEKLEQTSHTKKLSCFLIEDYEGPIIYGDDISIYLNQSVDLNSKFQCIDAVDGEVECMIDGTYDNQNIGSYPISIQAKDQSDNVSEKNIFVKVIKKVSDKPYAIDVIRNQNVVVVYGQDDYGEYSRVVQVFVCSTGRNNATPTGTFYTTKGGIWGSLYGGVWGQYTTRITGDILFHSVPYYSQNKGDLEWEEYNKFGMQASLGCVRLAVRDVKWIFYHCPVGTRVHIYDGDLPVGVSKPSSITIDGASPNRGWDPTDDDVANPWNA